MPDLQTNSKNVRLGDTFLAQKGLTVDGHDYIADAIANGATDIIAQYIPEGYTSDILIQVTSDPLWQIVKSHYDWSGLKIIGVTGTNGKTSTTHILYELLQASGHKCGLIGTNRIMIGGEELQTECTTPDALELAKLFCKMNNNGCTYCVMEVSSHALDQGRVGGIQFDIAAFTNLSPEHLDWHKSMEAYFESKAQLFKQSNKSIIMVETDYGRQLADLLKGFDTEVIELGEITDKSESVNAERPRDYYYKVERLLPDRVQFGLCHMDNTVQFEWSTPGEFSVKNASLALAIYAELGLDLNVTSQLLTKVPAVKGRMETISLNSGVTVVIDYAHSPDALEKCILALRQVVSGKLLVLFGCGGDRDKAKRPLMGQIAAKYADYTILTSDNPRTENPEVILDEIERGFLAVATNQAGDKPKYERIESRVEAIGRAVDLASELGSDPTAPATVLLAGKGQETYQEINGVKHHLDEREVLANL